jgi:prepilin-type N-terminal cleavage/methylation domain-containing protein
MKTSKKTAGFTLIELMIVVAIIAIIASIAIPKLMSARISANENAAIATLRSIASAQHQLESSSAIDTDADGGGEFGYFGELSGVAPLRFYDGAMDAAAIGVDVLNPPILPTGFGDILSDGADGIVERSGYFFKMFLPDATDGAGLVRGLPELFVLGQGGADPAALPNADNCEILWACYAWPVEASRTGNRAFFINQEGDLLQTLTTNAVVPYNGVRGVPAFDAAYSNESPADMGSRLGVTAMLIDVGFAANDGNTWTIVGN